MKRRRVQVALVGVVALALLAAAAWWHWMRRTGFEAGVLARVGGNAISAAAFQEEMSRRQRGQTLADREALLQELIRLESLYAKAVAAGYDRQPELVQQFKRLVADRYERDQAPRLGEAPKPSEEQARKYYQDHLPRFTQPEQARVALIHLRVPLKAEPERRQARRQEAGKVREVALARAEAEPSFGELAQAHSEDQATRYRGGDCGWIVRGRPAYRWGQKVLEAMFALRKPGEISSVIEAEDGFYLVKLIESKPRQTEPFAQVREQIQHRLGQAMAEQHRQQVLRELTAGVPVEVHLELLQQIEPPREVARNSREERPLGPTQ
jgi:parvulin-like peptidyl-prolyl isomerase